MANDRYRFWTEWSEEDGEWVGLCDGFPLVSWLEPDREAAEAGIRTLVAEAIEYLTAEGKPLPEPDVEWPPRSAGFKESSDELMGAAPDPMHAPDAFDWLVDIAEDIEDRRELAAALAEDDFVPWEEAKAELGLE